MKPAETAAAPTPAETAEWERILAAKPERLDWHGWLPGSGYTAVEWFNDREVSCRCVCRCEDCGFNYLDDKGEPLKRTNTPLCGQW